MLRLNRAHTLVKNHENRRLLDKVPFFYWRLRESRWLGEAPSPSADFQMEIPYFTISGAILSDAFPTATFPFLSALGLRFAPGRARTRPPTSLCGAFDKAEASKCVYPYKLDLEHIEKRF